MGLTCDKGAWSTKGAYMQSDEHVWAFAFWHGSRYATSESALLKYAAAIWGAWDIDTVIWAKGA